MTSERDALGRTPTPAIHRFLAHVQATWDLPAPTCIVEADGDLCLDWEEARNRVLSVSVRDDGRLSYAALIGEWKTHGTCQLATLSQDLQDAFTRFAKGNSR